MAIVIKCPDGCKWELDLVKVEKKNSELFLHVTCYACGKDYSGFLIEDRIGKISESDLSRKC